MPAHMLRYISMLLPYITQTLLCCQNKHPLYNFPPAKADMPCVKAHSCPDTPYALHIKQSPDTLKSLCLAVTARNPAYNTL